MMNRRTSIWRKGIFAIAVAAAAILMPGVSRAKAATIPAPVPATMETMDVLAEMPIGVSALASGPAAPAEASTDPKDLSEEVRDQLVTLPWLGVFDNLQYAVDGDQIVLKGQVVEPLTRSDAESAIRRIAGVARIENDIQVLPVSPLDGQIRRAEFHAIFSSPALARYAMGAVPTIHIVVDNGHVTLEGVVASEADRTIANLQALSVPDTFSVTNNLQIS